MCHNYPMIYPKSHLEELSCRAMGAQQLGCAIIAQAIKWDLLILTRLITPSKHEPSWKVLSFLKRMPAFVSPLNICVMQSYLPCQTDLIFAFTNTKVTAGIQFAKTKLPSGTRADSREDRAAKRPRTEMARQ